MALGGCSNAVTMTGIAPATGETFAGMQDPGPFGIGFDGLNSPMRFASSNGPICEGRPSGEMTLAVTCADGRTGTLTFKGAPPTTGSGTVGKDQVTMMIAARGG